MESMHENSKTAVKRKEIFSEIAELLEEGGFFTREETNRIKNIIWQEEVFKGI